MAKSAFQKTVLAVALANLAYFFVEFTFGLRIGAVSLLADAIDFVEDALVNLLIFAALGWSIAARARAGMVLAALVAVPGLGALWMVVEKLLHGGPPHPLTLSLVGLGALAVNCACALALAKWRNTQGSLTKAAFLSARNDAAANMAIIAAGVVTGFYPSVWPDVIAGLGIAAMNLDAAHEVYEAAKAEKQQAAA